MPANIVQLTEAIINAGATIEDMNYTMELVMTGTPARHQQLQIPLMKLLLDRGASAGDLLSVLAHRELEPVRFLIDNGVALTAAIAAALGRVDKLPGLLAAANSSEKTTALGIAVINQQLSAARLCVEAGADMNEYLPVHAHSLPTHQAAVNDDVEMLRLLVENGGRLDLRDKLWNSTPLGWATYMGKKSVEAYLRSIGAP
jgi:ankyrin repeat protein